MYIFEHLNNFIVMFRLMWEAAAGANFYLSAVLFLINRIARAVPKRIHRTIAKEAVQLLHALMTGIILAGSVFKIAMGWFHGLVFLSLPG